jgi:hypothetical protein
MFNKDSCRSCGRMLISDLVCNNCNEIILWKYSNCSNTEEYIHIRNQDRNRKA